MLIVMFETCGTRKQHSEATRAAICLVEIAMGLCLRTLTEPMYNGRLAAILMAQLDMLTIVAISSCRF